MANKNNQTNGATHVMSRGTKILIAAMIVVFVAAVSVAVWAIFFREDVIITPDYAPPEKEENAEKIEGEDDTKLEAPDGGGAVEVSYNYDVSIDLSDKKVSLSFANPKKSTHLMVVQVVIHDTVVAQSGTLDPGYRVRTLDMLSGTDKMLRAGGYDGKIVVLFYDPDSSEKSIVNTEIPLTINVQE